MWRLRFSIYNNGTERVVEMESVCCEKHEQINIWSLTDVLPVSFINDQIRPRKFHECVLFYIADLVGGDYNIPIAF